MSKANRSKRRATVTAARRTRGSLAWYAATGLIVVVGVVLVIFSRNESDAAERPRANFDHWHVALGVNVCGAWQGNAPEFHQRAGSSVQAGIHSHGDGLIHIHPYTSDESGSSATLGRYLQFGGWSVSADSMSLWEEGVKTNGEMCGDQAGVVRWSVNGKEKTGDPSDYLPKDQDVIALAFLPEGEEIGEPPQKASLAAPSDVEPGDVSASTTAPSDTASTAPGDTAPTTAPADTTAPGDTATTVPSDTTAPGDTTAAPTTAAPTETTTPPSTSAETTTPPDDTTTAPSTP